MNINISNAITACNLEIDLRNSEIAQLKSRVDYLKGVQNSLPPTEDYAERWKGISATLSLICATICSVGDHGVVHTKYDSVIVERTQGGDAYKWYITFTAHDQVQKVPIPSTISCIPLVSSAATEGFLKYLHSKSHITYVKTHEVLVLSQLHNLMKCDLPPKLNLQDYQ